jgi:flagellar biosynthesis protein FlhB
LAEEIFEEKTEKATPKKREEIRKKGDVAKSKELPSVAVLLAGLIVLSTAGSFSYLQIETLVKRILSFELVGDFTPAGLLLLGDKVICTFLLALAPLLSAVFVTAFLSNVAQVGFVVSPEAVKPNLSKLDPVKGLQRLLSAQSLMELIKSLLKLSIIGVVAYLCIRQEMVTLSRLADMETSGIAASIVAMTLKILMKCAVAMIALVALDYGFQKWDFEKRIRMSRKELKEELKRTEGDPLIKSRIRSIQMQMARKRMMQAVPKADVVITNPTHLAVALKYDGRTMDVPKVIAKGARRLAEKIKELAQKHGIPIVENKALAQNLYSNVEVGHEIPSTVYQAVAEVLAYIYRMKGRTASSRGK